MRAVKLLDLQGLLAWRCDVLGAESLQVLWYWRDGIMQCLQASCKPRDETEAEMSPAKRSLYRDVRMVYLRVDQCAEELLYRMR